MIEAVAAHGYAATTVDEIVGLAGVSTKTLYKHFLSKQECFLCTYDAVMEELAGRIGAAWREGAREDDRTAGLARGLDALALAIECQPDAVRLALVEVLAAGPAVLGRIERAQLGFERIIAQGLDHASGRAVPPLLARGIAGGIWYATRARLDTGVEQPQQLAGELLRWMLAYDSPAVQLLAPRLAAEGWDEAVPLDRKGAAEGDARTRILWTAARIAGREGYEELSVARILAEAGVSDEAFFALYDNVEECFVAALELQSAQALARVVRAGHGAPDSSSAVCTASAALMRHIAADPVFARCAFVEIFAAGAAGAACRERLLRRLAELIERAAPGATPLVAEAVVGAVWSIIHHEVVRDAAHALPYLADHVAYVVLAPSIGAEQAAGAILDARSGDDERSAGELAPVRASL
jgi:AcrR family transcriptional regulator